MNYLLILINVLLLVTGQTLWKIGVEKFGFLSVKNILEVVFSPFIVAGIILYGIATLLWIYLLSKFPLSLLYPLQSLAYIFGMLLAIVIFKEHIPFTRWIGVGFIMLGVYFVSK